MFNADAPTFSQFHGQTVRGKLVGDAKLAAPYLLSCKRSESTQTSTGALSGAGISARSTGCHGSNEAKMKVRKTSTVASTEIAAAKQQQANRLRDGQLNRPAQESIPPLLA